MTNKVTFNGAEYDTDNPYENAAMRWEAAKAFLQLTKKRTAEILEMAQETADAAERNLQQYEIAPGIPDPQYLPFQENSKTMADILEETDLLRNGQ